MVEISDVNDLQAINNDLDGSYELVNDIDASGFNPIGVKNETTYSNNFGGTLNGNGYTISGLYINKSDWNEGVGLCRKAIVSVLDTASIYNFHIDSADITNSSQDGSGVGAIAGSIDDDNEIHDIVVKNSSITGYGATGGITGIDSFSLFH